MEDTQLGGAQTSQVGDKAVDVNSQSADSGGSSQTTEKKSTKTVSWENHQTALSDMHKYKKLVTDLEARLGDAESQKLREKEDYKTLAQRAEAKAKDAEERYQKLNSYIQTTEKLREITKHAVAKGIRPEALQDLELLPDPQGVAIELTSSGRFLVNGADSFIDDLKSQKPHWFTQTQPPRVNGSGGGTLPEPGKKITVQDVMQAERALRSGKMSKDQYRQIRLQYEQHSSQK